MKSDAIDNCPRVTFGMIVLNGNPFIKYNLRSIYPFAHQIIVVEGACPAASNVATLEGHSIDGTLDELKRFKANEDFEDKLIIITAESVGKPNGFWLEKTEMSQAYAEKATGNYLWQVDSDEFYSEQDIQAILALLANRPSISQISFKTINFWGGLEYKVDGILLKLGDQNFRRLFKWSQGSTYLNHRPPTVVNANGVDMADECQISAEEMERKGIFLYHYEYLFINQVKNKTEYYSKAPHCKGLRPNTSWFEDCFMNLYHPYRVHNIISHLSWLERYFGSHPSQVSLMLLDVVCNNPGNIRINLDVECLLNKKSYRMAILLLKGVVPIIKFYLFLKYIIKLTLIHLKIWDKVQFLRFRL
jgi:hypothetical protein